MGSKLRKMMLAKSAVFATAGWLLAVGFVAHADETTIVSRSAPDTKNGLYNAFEIGVALGYTQGVGDVGDGVRSLTDSGGPGVSGEVDLGWRINPNWLVGVYGTTGWLSTGDSAGNAHNNWTTSAGIQGAYHFMPGVSSLLACRSAWTFPFNQESLFPRINQESLFPRISERPLLSS